MATWIVKFGGEAGSLASGFRERQQNERFRS